MTANDWTFLLSGFAIGVSVASIAFNIALNGWKPWRRAR